MAICKIKSSESFSKQPTQLIIVAHNCHICFELTRNKIKYVRNLCYKLQCSHKTGLYQMSYTKLFKAQKDKNLSKNSSQSPTTKQFAGYYSNKCLRSKTFACHNEFNSFLKQHSYFHVRQPRLFSKSQDFFSKGHSK